MATYLPTDWERAAHQGSQTLAARDLFHSGLRRRLNQSRILSRSRWSLSKQDSTHYHKGNQPMKTHTGRNLIQLLLGLGLMAITASTSQAQTQTFKLVADDYAAGDGFGSALSLSGEFGLVTAPDDDDNGDGSGSAYVFDVNTGQQLLKLWPDDGVAQSGFGGEAAIDGNLAVITSGGYNNGAADVFDVTTGQQLFKVTPADGAPRDFFGQSVALSGRIALIAAAISDDAGPVTGSAYLFDVTTGQQLAKILADDGASGDSFGGSVAISSNTALIGAANANPGAILAGAAYVFQIEPPAILSQPVSVTNNVGADVMLSVEADAIGQMDFQWKHDGIEIPGATNRDLSLTNIQESDQGSYAVVVSDPFGSVTSSPALLVVNQFPIADANATGLFWTSPNGIDANVVLDGSRSSDPDCDPLTLLWLTGSTPIATGLVEVVTLPVGEHAVELVVDDGLAQDTDTITVTVLTADQSVERLESLVGASDLTDTQQMLSSLGAALASIDRGSWISAVNQLHAFQNKVGAQVAPYESDLAAELTQVAAQIIDALGGDSSVRGNAKIRSLKRSPNAGVHLVIEAAAGSVHVVEASTNLNHWDAIGTTIEADGTIQFEQTQDANRVRCFYRVVTP
jgi:FG-GAP repeat/Immunoglobulin domain